MQAFRKIGGSPAIMRMATRSESTQRAQCPLNKEYTLIHRGLNIMISGKFKAYCFFKGYWALWVCQCQPKQCKASMVYGLLAASSSVLCRGFWGFHISQGSRMWGGLGFWSQKVGPCAPPGPVLLQVVEFLSGAWHVTNVRDLVKQSSFWPVNLPLLLRVS